MTEFRTTKLAAQAAAKESQALTEAAKASRLELRNRDREAMAEWQAKLAAEKAIARVALLEARRRNRLAEQVRVEEMNEALVKANQLMASTHVTEETLEDTLDTMLLDEVDHNISIERHSSGLR